MSRSSKIKYAGNLQVLTARQRGHLALSTKARMRPHCSMRGRQLRETPRCATEQLLTDRTGPSFDQVVLSLCFCQENVHLLSMAADRCLTVALAFFPV